MKTHEHLDMEFVKSGKFTIKEINEMHREFEQVGIALDKSQLDAKTFLKRKMGIIVYFIWDRILTFGIGRYLSAGFGHDGYEEKAKEMGWNNTFKYPKGFN